MHTTDNVLFLLNGRSIYQRAKHTIHVHVQYTKSKLCIETNVYMGMLVSYGINSDNNSFLNALEIVFSVKENL